MKKILAAFLALIFIGIAGFAALFASLSSNLPQIMKVEDYKPLLVSEVYARGGEKIGEFYREVRILTPFEKIPKHLVNAFVATEDEKFFEHEGINYTAIMRAMLKNLQAGRTVQGGSTITQQTAKTLLLTSERTYGRKIREALLAQRMEQNLKKEEILFLYLNQIYFGEGAHGVAAAAERYFRKPLDKLTLAEMAILAGLPPAPEKLAPTKHPQRAKERQKLVLGRMVASGYISKEEADKAAAEPVTIYLRKDYKDAAPFFVETLRQLLIQELGEDQVLDAGLKIHTTVDYEAQLQANEAVRMGLRDVDKRQGYRGPMKAIEKEEDVDAFLLETRKKLVREKNPTRILLPDGNSEPEKPLTVTHIKDKQGSVISNLPDYVSKGDIVEGFVTKVDDALGLVHVKFADAQGLIDIADMGWARKPDPTVNAELITPVKKPSAVLKRGDVILIKVTGEKFASPRLEKDLATARKAKKPEPKDLPDLEEYAHLALEQEPIVEAALISFDQKTQEIMAMVGGYDFARSEFNRAVQAARQTGSSFKAIVYAAALDKGYTPASPVTDAPIVFEETDPEAVEGQDDTKKWKPSNYTNKFAGDILFRTALIRSLNIPTVKILEDLGIPWAMDYARRLGIFSALNNDFTFALGSSGVTLYEMTKVFSQFGRLGQRIRPLMIHKVLDHSGKPLMQTVSLDKRFERELFELDRYFDEKRKEILAAQEADAANGEIQKTGTAVAGSQASVQGAVPSPTPDPSKKKHPDLYYKDPDQLMSPTTSYLLTSILQGSITEDGGTAGRARALGRPVAGKTGTTSGYYDTWFIGYTPQVATGVWVGFDEEKTLGVGEAGGKTAIPIWLEYMKAVHNNLPAVSFPVPPGIVFANIDNKTGKLASANSKQVVYQAFAAGSEPKELSDAPGTKDESEFLKEDLSE